MTIVQHKRIEFVLYLPPMTCKETFPLILIVTEVDISYQIKPGKHLSITHYFLN